MECHVGFILMCEHLTPSYFRTLRGMPLIAVGERERTSRPSRRVALSNDTLRDPGSLRQSFHRRAGSSPTACLDFLHVGYLLVWKSFSGSPRDTVDHRRRARAHPTSFMVRCSTQRHPLRPRTPPSEPPSVRRKSARG